MRNANSRTTNTSSAPPSPAVAGVTEKAVPRLNRSSRIGLGGGTAPFGMPTTTVRAPPGEMVLCANVAVVPLLVALPHGRVDRSGPLKHATCVMSAGASTVTLAERSPESIENETGPKLVGAFKPPSLRNVARTAPYFHDGSVSNLRDAVKFMAGGGKESPQRDPLLKDQKLSDKEIDQLVAFLESLSGNDAAFTAPAVPQ